ncbi:hypothetical protein CVT24_007265 [Panaeolus cyanescens]|uniref:Uncharacterized protein n=1 Tax=Panaeolus cyanescens TaxID=181874 RepID=A0A409W5B0_9AGAR|nr:hypothetical protein CVT24_007265 [Panaeolus cyanescens]
MDSTDQNRHIGRITNNNPQLRDATGIMAIMRQHIPQIDNAIITQALLQKVKDVLVQNIDKITPVLSGALVALGTSVLLPTLFITVIQAIGFTSGGVAAGSLAALIQSTFYGAWTGGIFSGLQSIGAVAVVPPPITIGIAVASVVVGGGYLLYRHFKRRRIALDASSDESQDHDEDDGASTSLIRSR